MKVFKYALAAAGALVLVAVLFVAYFVFTFDVRDHEPRIVALVKEKTGRTLIVQGETRLALWPDLGLQLGRVALTERDSDAIFAEVANARLVAKLRPLLSRQLVADELHLEGASVRIVRFADGRLNVDDLLSGEGGALDFDIARARVERSRVVYEDVAGGARHELSQLDLVTGRLKSGVATPIKLSFKAAAEERYGVAANVQGRLTFDLTRRAHALDDAVISVEGKFANVGDLSAQMKGAFGWSDGVLAANALTLNGRGRASGRAFETSAAVAEVRRTNGGVDAASVVLEVRTKADDDAMRATLKAPQLAWRDGAVTAAASGAELELARGAQMITAAVSANARLSDAGRYLELSDVRSKFAATGPGLPRRGMHGAVAGAASVDLESQRVQAKLTGTVLDTRVKGTVGVSGFAAPSYTFALDLDALDLDRIEMTSGAGKSGGFDLAELSNVRAAGTLRVASFRSGGVVAKNVQLALKP